MIKVNQKFLVLVLVLVLGISFLGGVARGQQGATTTGAAASSAVQTEVVATGVTAVEGEKHAAKCAAQSYWDCGMKVLAVAQIGMLAASLFDTNKTKEAVDCVGCGPNSVDPNLDDPYRPTHYNVDNGNNNEGEDIILPNLPGLPTRSLRDLIDLNNKDLKDLKNKGYSFEDGKLKFPNGQSYSPEAMGSASTMAALGMSKEGIEAELANQGLAKKKLEDLLKKYANVGGIEEGGGGGVSAGKSKGASTGSLGFDPRMFMPKGNDLEKRGVAGLEKKLGNDSIGVAQDDLFSMIHRRYQIKKPDLKP